MRKAVDLAAVTPAERERYGRNLFGQSVMLGKRLLDAGARLVQCNWQRTQGKNGFAWDTHWNNFSAHKEDLVPPFDLAFDALMTDLEKTGRLDETLVVVAAEFGRSPKITRSNSGREHWPECYSRAVRRRRHQGRPGLRPIRQDTPPIPRPIRPRRPISRPPSTTAWASIRTRRRTIRATDPSFYRRVRRSPRWWVRQQESCTPSTAFG